MSWNGLLGVWLAGGAARAEYKLVTGPLYEDIATPGLEQGRIGLAGQSWSLWAGRIEGPVGWESSDPSESWFATHGLLWTSSGTGFLDGGYAEWTPIDGLTLSPFVARDEAELLNEGLRVDMDLADVGVGLSAMNTGHDHADRSVQLHADVTVEADSGLAAFEALRIDGAGPDDAQHGLAALGMARWGWRALSARAELFDGASAGTAAVHAGLPDDLELGRVVIEYRQDRPGSSASPFHQATLVVVYGAALTTP